MTDAAAVLADLRARGVEVRAEGGRLRLRGPSSAVSELRGRVLEAKPQLLLLLSGHELDQGLAMREVLGFPAALLVQLPLATSLVLGAQRRVVSARSTEWRRIIAAAHLGPSATVRDVLNAGNLELVAVVIDGGAE